MLFWATGDVSERIVILLTGIGVGVGVGMGVGTGVGMVVGVAVGVGTGLGVGVGVDVRIGVAVSDGVGVGVTKTKGVSCVAVGVGDGVRVGVEAIVPPFRAGSEPLCTKTFACCACLPTGRACWTLDTTANCGGAERDVAIQTVLIVTANTPIAMMSLFMER